MTSEDIQTLLDVEAQLSNKFKGEAKDQIELIHKVIRNNRGENKPLCFGQDDCSTLFLSMCPWRFDCGE